MKLKHIAIIMLALVIIPAGVQAQQLVESDTGEQAPEPAPVSAATVSCSEAQSNYLAETYEFARVHRQVLELYSHIGTRYQILTIRLQSDSSTTDGADQLTIATNDYLQALSVATQRWQRLETALASTSLKICSDVEFDQGDVQSLWGDLRDGLAVLDEQIVEVNNVINNLTEQVETNEGE